MFYCRAPCLGMIVMGAYNVFVYMFLLLQSYSILFRKAFLRQQNLRPFRYVLHVHLFQIAVNQSESLSFPAAVHFFPLAKLLILSAHFACCLASSCLICAK